MFTYGHRDPETQRLDSLASLCDAGPMKQSEKMSST